MTTLYSLLIQPLPYVVFPGEPLRIHIAPTPHHSLIYSSLNQPGEAQGVFGVVRTTDITTAQIGCEVKITSPVEIQSDGSLDVIVRGGRRFEIVGSALSALYTRAEINYFFDTDPIDLSLANRAITIYMKVIELAKGETVTPTFTPGEPISFILGRGAGLSLEQRQELIEMRSEKSRLEALITYCQDTIAILQKAHTIRETIQTNGHIRFLKYSPL